MSLSALDGLLWLLAALLPFLLVQRWVQREFQAVFLLLSRRPALSYGLIALLFFPGVLLHETSHYLMARLLWVRTGRFSLLPRPLPNGQLQLGFVETEKADWVRDALIGTAPLLVGGAVTAYIGVMRLGLGGVSEAFRTSGGADLWLALRALPQQPDFWLWFYLAFTISAMMLPSASDRRAWLPLGLTLALLTGLVVLAGAGPWMMANLAPWFNRGLYGAAMVFGISLGVHMLLALPVWLLRRLISRVTGLRLVEETE